MAVYTESVRPFEAVLTEAAGTRSRAAVTVASGADLTAGTVLGQITLGAATVTPGGTNTGDATLTVAALLDGAKVGDYTITCITAPTGAGANNAVFSVIDPDGYRLADLTQAVAYTDDLSMTIGAASAADSIVGDTYTVTVAAGSGKYAQVDLTSVDGSQTAAAVLCYDADAASADANVTAIVRDAELIGSALVYPTGATEGDKTNINTALAAAGIIVS